MSRSLFPVILSCLFVLSPLRAETMRVELKYVAVEDMLRRLLRESPGPTTEEAVEALVKKGKARIKGTSIEIDPALNDLSFDGEAEDLQRLSDFVAAIDVRPDQVHLKCVLMEVKLDDALKRGVDLFGAHLEGGPAIIKGEEADLDALVKKAEDSKRVTVRSRPIVYTASNQEATISLGEVDGNQVTLKLTPLVNSPDEVTVTMAATTMDGDKNWRLNTTVRLGNANVVIVGGSIDTDEEGNRTEALILFQPEIIMGEEEGEKAIPFEN